MNRPIKPPTLGRCQVLSGNFNTWSRC